MAWTFHFDHLVFAIDGEPSYFDATVGGSFVGDDVNGDGTLTLSELKTFDMDSRRFFPDHQEILMVGPSQWAVGESTSAFSFDGALHFAGESFGYKTQKQYAISSTGFDAVQYVGGSNAYQTYWGPQTTFTIAPMAAPVSEAAPVALLPAGFALLATV